MSHLILKPGNGSAIGLLEFKSIARGISTTDVMVKKAEVTILASYAVSPGKYITLVSGEVANVEESVKAGIEKAGDLLIHHLFLPQVHESVIPAISGTQSVPKILSLGILETFSVASCIVAADIAVKTAPVQFVKLSLANGLGGKAYFVITGLLHDVEAALDSSAGHVRNEGLLTAVELIQNPHPDFSEYGII